MIRIIQYFNITLHISTAQFVKYYQLMLLSLTAIKLVLFSAVVTNDTTVSMTITIRMYASYTDNTVATIGHLDLIKVSQITSWY